MSESYPHPFLTGHARTDARIDEPTEDLSGIARKALAQFLKEKGFYKDDCTLEEALKSWGNRKEEGRALITEQIGILRKAKELGYLRDTLSWDDLEAWFCNTIEIPDAELVFAEILEQAGLIEVN